MLGLMGHLDHLTTCAFELFRHSTYFLHMLSLLLILHHLSLLALLGGWYLLLLLSQESLMLLRVSKVLLLHIQIHTLNPLMLNLVYLVIDFLLLLNQGLSLVSVWHALDAWVSIVLAQIDAVGSQGWIVLCLRLHLHSTNHLIVQMRQIIAIL